ncbi:dUTP diphosphatase [Mycoplasma leonicaptivi]|uniref:dUTP diphosphatase n=1 Tax=Mycoplasma leonicaptivi TaxID=36742 RepID=UPI000489E243|nr:dUTP diphosphatase [Mycoplasma leonicaptivi]
MNLEEIFTMQKKLDIHIDKKRQITNPQIDKQSLLTQRLLALIVEASEFVNEVQSFKYWKQNKNINHKAIKEEFADLLHFFITLGYENNIPTNIEPKIVDIDINKQFKELFIAISNILQNCNYQTVYYAFSIALGCFDLLGFTYAEMFQAYFEKNQKNYKRLSTNY